MQVIPARELRVNDRLYGQGTVRNVTSTCVNPKKIAVRTTIVDNITFDPEEEVVIDDRTR